jgi:hypothetical protein
MKDYPIQHYIDKLQVLKEYMADQIEYDYVHFYIIPIYKEFGVIYQTSMTRVTFEEYYQSKQNEKQAI